MSSLKLNKIPTLRGRRLRWIEALESGRYKQTSDQLQDAAGFYCCLGVACQLSGMGKFKLDTFWTINDGEHDEVSLRNLPSIRKLLRMTHKQHFLATALNDGDHYRERYEYEGRKFERKAHSFKEIATIFRNIWRLGKAA